MGSNVPFVLLNSVSSLISFNICMVMVTVHLRQFVFYPYSSTYIFSLSFMFDFLSMQEPNDIVSHSKLCKHEYHTDCIHQWLEKYDTCPCCRRNVFRS